MNTKNTTPPNTDRYLYKVPFSVYGRLALIDSLSKMGVVIKVDPTRQHACACFDNTQDYNDFKNKLAALV